MPSSTDKQSNTTSQSTATQQSAYAPQVSDLNTAFTDAMKAYGQSGSATLPTDFVANFSPEALASFRSMVNYGNNNAVPNGQAAAGTDLLTSGVNGTNGALSGFAGYDPSVTNNADALVSSANKYVAGQDIDSQVRQAMQGATETARDVTMPQISQNAALSGNTNSSRTGIAEGLVQRGLAESAANLRGTLSSQAFKDGLTLAQSQAASNNADKLAAIQGQGALGTAAASAGNTASTSSVDNMMKQLTAAATGGAGLTSAQQAQLDNALKQYQAGSSAPFASLSQLMSIIGGNHGMTTNTTGSGNTDEHSETTASPLSIAGGILGAGTSLLGSGGMNLLAPAGAGILSSLFGK